MNEYTQIKSDSVIIEMTDRNVTSKVIALIPYMQS